MTDDTQRISINISTDLYSKLDEELDHGERSEIVRETLRTVANGGWDHRSPYDIALQRKHRQLREVEGEIDDLQREAQDLRRDIEILQKKKDEQPTKDEIIDETIRELETKVRAGMNAHPTSSHITAVADDLGMDVDELITRIRERNPDLPDIAFEEPHPLAATEPSIDGWYGFDDKKRIDLPPGEREED